MTTPKIWTEDEIYNRILEIEERFENDYADKHRALREQQSVLTRQQASWKIVVDLMKKTLVDSGNFVEDDDDLIDADAVVSTLLRELSEYYKFKKLIEYIEANPLLKSQWDRLVMSIRLTGGDDNE